MRLSLNRPTDSPISENDFSSPEISITVYENELESDKEDLYSEFLEEDDITRIDRALNHYREIVKPNIEEINIEK